MTTPAAAHDEHAAYDEHADWYEDYTWGRAGTYTQRRHELLRDLLGPGTGRCLDVCCGTGASAGVLRGLGWTPLGVDLSAGQLRHGRRRLPVARASAAALPVPDGELAAAVCVLAHTDVPDYPAVLREIARVLRPGGRFVHLGVHPCFVGAFADWGDPGALRLDDRYADRSYRHDAGNPGGVRVRVGAWHVPLAELLNGVADAGLRLVRAAEVGGRPIPDVLGLVAEKSRY